MTKTCHNSAPTPTNDHCKSEGKVRVGKKLKITLAIVIGLFAISYIPGMEALNQSFLSYLKLIWWAVLLGLVLGGAIDYLVPDEFIYKYLGKKRVHSLFFAVIAGFLLSACSHGILAIAMQLHKKGASIPAVITFLLASPWANLPVTFLLFGFFGAQALLFILAAMVIALVTGFIFMGLERAKLIEQTLETTMNEVYTWAALKQWTWKTGLRGVWRSTMNLTNMVLWWILLGFTVAVFIQAYVPGHIFVHYLGASIGGLLLTLAVATVIEICSEGSSPIAFEIYKQVGTLGNPFVFLMAGVATDYTEIGLIWTNIGKRTAIWLPIVTVPQVVLVGWLFNVLL